MDGTIIPFDDGYRKACYESIVKVTEDFFSRKLSSAFYGKKEWELSGMQHLVSSHGLHSSCFNRYPIVEQKLLYKARREMSLDYIEENQALQKKLIQLKDADVVPLILTNSEPSIAEEALNRLGVMDVIGRDNAFSFSVPTKVKGRFGIKVDGNSFGNLSGSILGGKGDFRGKWSADTYREIIDLLIEKKIVPPDTQPRQIAYLDDHQSFVDAAREAGWLAELSDEKEEPILETLGEIIDIKKNFISSINSPQIDLS